jgi:UDP-N-acetylglucosamine--N-acetylmuramyl-(pentapeptide) pyrophosphoryl-undecaprenol N-acetylglucosamine transferase
LAIAQEVRSRLEGSQVLYVGTKKGLESQIVPLAGIPFRTLDAAGLNQVSKWQKMRSLAMMPAAFRQARKIIQRFKPDVIIGTGGYVSFPILMAGTFWGCRTYIHEQNAFPGLANRVLARRVWGTMITFSAAASRLKAKRIVETGLPVRRELLTVDRTEALQELGLTAGKFTLLAFGGSLGAASINRAVRELVTNYSLEGMQIIWITGNNNYEQAQASLRGYAHDLAAVHIYPYLNEMEKALCSADLALCRSGAGTLSELCTLGIPSILVPYPYAANDHQTYNALALKQKGAAVIIPDDRLSGDLLYGTMEKLRRQPQRLAEMKQNALVFSHAGALDKIMQVIT